MRSKQLGFTLIELIVTVFGVGVIALLGVGLYVLAHFIAKVW